MMEPKQNESACGCRPGKCSAEGGLARRELLQLAAASTTLLTRSVAKAVAPSDNDYRIPTDKHLPEEWIRSLYARGAKKTYSSSESLNHIGMPIGGFFAGTVYLSGDGRLWLWDIFNRDQEGIMPRPFTGVLPNSKEDEVLVQNLTRAGLNFVTPAEPTSPFEQAFYIRIGELTKPISHAGFSQVTFDGRYPIGKVRYSDPAVPISVELEAFSPFITLNANDSSLPVVLLNYQVTNRAQHPVEAELYGVMQNPVLKDAAAGTAGRLRNQVLRSEQYVAVMSAAERLRTASVGSRPDIVFDDFERETYAPWTTEGDAFGSGPPSRKDIPGYQGDLGGHGDRVVNSHASAHGANVEQKDDRQGTLTSPGFVIERNFIQMYVGGGPHVGETCVELLVDDAVVTSVTGQSHNMMRQAVVDVRQWIGKKARLRVADRRSGAWGNIGIDHVVFTDRPSVDTEIEQLRDFGTICLGLLKPTKTDRCQADVDGDDAGPATKPLHEKLLGRVGRTVRLEPGQSATICFAIAWHFPNLTIRDMPGRVVGNHYATRFAAARDVLQYVADNASRLAGTTRRWVETWYDSTLPYWLLDRTMANTSTLATTTCYRFADGRFWAWEGVGCCPGTCTHVWHYAQAVGRLFPEIERDQRHRIDFGMALQADGHIGHRAYLNDSAGPAVDGHAGRILGVLREHQMSTNDRFLREIWPSVKKAIEWLIKEDEDNDGMIVGAQHNTLDAAWYGKIAWITSLYLAALRAGIEMARELDDDEFATRCEQILNRGRQSIVETFNGEYFIQIEDPNHAGNIATGNGCHIDQVFGQTWAHLLGLGHLFDVSKQLSALRSLWKYNFVPDIGPFRQKYQRGRWYAMAGDAGLLMCTWPHDDQNAKIRDHWQFGYFNECMSGFEWQVATHMIWEGLDHADLLQSGLAIARAIDDRYNAEARNPYNEIECSDHYARAMASYGVYQAVCGFQCHGPQKMLSFAPRLTPEKFRAAFVGPAGWGTFDQALNNEDMHVTLSVQEGMVALNRLNLRMPDSASRVVHVVRTNGGEVSFAVDDRTIGVTFDETAHIAAGESLEIVIQLQ